MKTAKITFKLVRSFTIGFTVHSPTLNGLSFDIGIACFHASVWGKGKQWIAFKSFWNA